MIHYGGDGGGTEYFRRGTLHLYNNTLVSTRSSNTTLVRLSTDDVTADVRNNIVYTSASSGHLALTNGAGIVKLKNNWISEGYRDTFESTKPRIIEDSGNIIGTNPGFSNFAGQDFNLNETSVCIDNAGDLNAKAMGYMPNMEYVKHQNGVARSVIGNGSDIGAFESAYGVHVDNEQPTIPVITNENPSKWALDAIEGLKGMNVVKIDLLNNYKNNISREDFAYLSVVLYKTLGGQNIPSVNPKDLETFSDTSNEYVLKAYKLNIVNGYGNGRFGPNDPVTREQIDVMLIKAMEQAGVTLDKSGANEIVFKDQSQISSWALEAVQLAYKNKIMSGVGDLTIAPKNNTTREQALVLIYNILSNEAYK